MRNSLHQSNNAENNNNNKKNNLFLHFKFNKRKVSNEDRLSVEPKEQKNK